MTARTHRKLLLFATAAWIGFWILGLPSYYQQYSASAMAWFDAILLIPCTLLFIRMLGRSRRERRATLALWMAFYFTVPLAIYDWLYCGVYLGHGARFLTLYWYVSVYYVVPWLILVPIAAILAKREHCARESASLATETRGEAEGSEWTT